jgi:heme/copper-type cytochrome/quinol oxidase subunit 4
MNSLIWIAQLALAGIFLVSGTLKLFAFAPFVHALQHRAHTAIAMSPMRGKLIGFVEVILAFGVMMPDIFTPEGLIPEYLIVRFSAAGLALIMVAACIFHMRRKESATLAISIFLLALFVIVGRWPAN